MCGNDKREGKVSTLREEEEEWKEGSFHDAIR
jgi:hypothetical protein